MSAGDGTPAEEQPPDRLDEFHAELARLRVKSTGRDDEQRLLFFGIVLMPIGLVVILIGYFGASGTTDFSAQVPYLLSGGILGLGLTIVGATLFLRYSLGRYLRFWLLRLIFEEHTTADRQVDALDRLGQQIVGGSRTSEGDVT